MTSTTTSKAAYVWVWLPGAREPIPAGVLRERPGETGLNFRYGTRYPQVRGAIPLYKLPFDGPEWRPATHNLGMPTAIRDSTPDSWGRRVVLETTISQSERTAYSEVDFLLETGSNRTGAIDFQATPTEFVPRQEPAGLDELIHAAELAVRGTPLTEGISRALRFASPIGGARPKVTLTVNGQEFIAKFSTPEDSYDVVGAEAAGSYLAERAGIPVSATTIVTTSGSKVLLIERFDRPGDGQRHMVVSALSTLGLPETSEPVGSYPALVQVLRRDGSRNPRVGADVFRRAAFNIAIGNTDDHPRNHAAFWDGTTLEMTPAFDLTPIPRTGTKAVHALALGAGMSRLSNFNTLTNAASEYGLSRRDARGIVDDIIASISANWADAAEFGELSHEQRSLLRGQAILHPNAKRPLD